jgi:hypothetical protein
VCKFASGVRRTDTSFVERRSASVWHRFLKRLQRIQSLPQDNPWPACIPLRRSSPPSPSPPLSLSPERSPRRRAAGAGRGHQARPVADLVNRVTIPYESFTLPNGLRVLVNTDRKAPVVAVSVWYAVGSKNEPKGKTGFAHLFEHLMFNGSEHAPGDFFEPLQQVGATDMNGTTWFDRTNYFETVPTAALDRTLMLESDRMGYLLGAVTQESSITSAASSRTRSGRATTSRSAWSSTRSWRRSIPRAIPITIPPSARWTT